MLYKVKNRGSEKKTLCTIYFALFHSYLNYGLTSWGLTTDTNLKKIETIQNKSIRAISGLKSFESCSNSYKELKLVKIKDMLYINIAKFVWDFENKSVPSCFLNFFQYAKTVHSYSTRFAHKNKFSKTRTPSTTQHGIMSFTNKAINVSNELKDTSWFHSIKSKKSLTKKLKSVFIESY